MCSHLKLYLCTDVDRCLVFCNSRVDIKTFFYFLFQLLPKLSKLMSVCNMKKGSVPSAVTDEECFPSPKQYCFLWLSAFCYQSTVLNKYQESSIISFGTIHNNKKENYCKHRHKNWKIYKNISLWYSIFSTKQHKVYSCHDLFFFLVKIH